jgi:signal transduction histidine kinase
VHNDMMIATIMRQSPADDRTRSAAWRQLSDILAQRGNQLGEFDVRRALHALALLRTRVGEAVRRDTAVTLAGQCNYAPLVALYSADTPPVAAAMLSEAQLSDDDWLALLPSTNAVARSVLAQRRDLTPKVRRALASMGAAQPALPAAMAADVSPAMPIVANDSGPVTGAAGDQIRELVRRIDTFRSRQQNDSVPTNATSFLFETGPDGVVRWAEGIARGAVIGVTLAQPALANEPGVDGAVAGAFRRRSEIINARLNLGQGASDGGDWRLSAWPCFDSATGQFRGYRGSARRPRRNEVAYGSPVDTSGGDTVRQLIHELRSPLNAISGFGQIIAGQMFGPVNQRYRGMASAIVDDAGVLQQIIEDLDSSARGVVAVDTSTSARIDLGQLLGSITAELAPIIADRAITWSVTRIGSAFLVQLPHNEAKRMIGRLLTAIVDVAEDGETVMAQLIDHGHGAADAELRIVRPRAIRHSNVSDLLDPGFDPHGDAPAAAMLSLGFSLRLVDNLARGCGGALNIGANALTLQLPTGHVQSQGDVQEG